MRTFIQLRDGIGYATIITPTDEPDHSITPDHTTAVEVFTADPDQFLNMEYDAETKSWTPAPIIYWAQVNNQGQIIEIGRTYFEHLVPTDAHIMPDGADSYWKYIDGEWVAPVIFVPSEEVQEESQTMIESPHAEEEQN